MKRSGFTEEQIIRILCEQEAGRKTGLATVLRASAMVSNTVLVALPASALENPLPAAMAVIKSFLFIWSPLW